MPCRATGRFKRKIAQNVAQLWANAFISLIQHSNHAHEVSYTYTTALLYFAKNLTYALAGFEPGPSVLEAHASPTYILSNLIHM
jgi:hypothetical protein